MRNNPTLRPSKLRTRRRKIFALKSIGFFLLLIGLVFLLSLSSKNSAIQITEIEVFGNTTISKDEIINLVKKEMSGKYFMLFSKNSVFLYPKKTIEEKILADFKKVQKMEIKSNGLKMLQVSLNERKPDFMWCANNEEIEASKNKNLNDCYFLDKEGVVFSEAPDFSGNAYMRYYGLINDANPLGEVYMPIARFKEITNFIGSLKSLGIAATEFRAESESDYEIYLENGIKIIFDNRQSFNKTLGNIQSILREIDLKSNYSASNPPKYNIVDLRLGNKIFLKNE